ncbi:hypothetical protein FLW53_09640 [Microbispora sp. SCL1-1]|uniref:hypothetical protein n=1 Tax=unclassified Microbispora TaxID=2614687 RepID=UPI00115C0E35|nr:MULTISPECIES: hypothetical protein [unclassified Microbispora]NJP24466.1 hypothetical protein [Microbispora sp. CL1-1]TQS14612.1 hypothetical protein FLW53_09640 [Microbispora sp. SCL1-1]
MAATMVRDLRANLSLGMSDEEFQRGMDGLKRSAPRDGEQIAGAFSKAFSRQLGAAFRSLPQAEITADSSDAEIKVNALRSSLRELANKRIGIDIDSASALGEMRAIRSELEGLQQTGDIAVRADVTRALAALNSVEREVEKLDRQDVDIDVDVDGAAAAVTQVGLLEKALSSVASVGPARMAAVAGAISLLPIAGSAAAGAIVTVLGGALAAVGLAASRGSETAQAALERLRQAAETEAARTGQPFEKVWVTIADEAERQLGRFGPIVRRNLEQLAPTVQSFVRDAGESLGELEPALDGIARAFAAVLADLGPAMPEIMGHLAAAITEVTSAVEENPEAITEMVNALATLVEWGGKVLGFLTRLKGSIDDNAAVFHVLANAVLPGSTALYALVDGLGKTEKAATTSAQATQAAAVVADQTSSSLASLAAAYGLAGDDSVAAAQKMLDAWSSAYSAFGNLGGALQTIEQRTRASTGGTNRQAQASERLAEVQRQAAEKIQRAERDVADASERATERVAQAKRQLSDAHERAAEQVATAQERVADAQEAVSEAVEQAAQREADAVARVEEARERAAQAAEDAGRKIAQAEQRVADAQEDAADRVADAEQRVADAQEDAADRVVDAERRLQDSHARTADAVEDLTRAREQAAERLEDLQRQTAGIELDEESAQLAIERARLRMQEVNADPKATDLDRREADLAYRQALQRLDDVRQRNADLREELADAQRAGIEGSDEVIQAKERIAQAQQEEQDAELALAKAREDAAKQVAQAEQGLADARKDAARQVAAAEQGLADARKDAARQQQDAERELARAEAEVDQARIAGAKDVQKAKEDLAKAETDAAKTARDAARDVADAEEALRKTKKDVARDIQDAEAALTKARQDAARDVMKANSDVAGSWSSMGGTVKVTTQEYLAELEKQVKAQEDWASNLISLAGRVPDEMLKELAELGPGGAQIVELATQMSDAELRKFIDLHGRSGKEAGDTFAKNLAEAGPVLREIARQRGEEVADKVREGMNNGATSVYEAARRIGLRITQEVGPEHKIRITADAAPAYGVLNQLLHDIGLSSANVSVGVLQNANGNILMANGGVLSFAGGAEQHIAQIAGPGTRIWAEPETQGEAYIPLAPSKRARSEEILSKVADMFGGAFVKAAPAGGMPVAGGDGATTGGGISIGQITLAFADDRDMYTKGAEFAAGLREYARRGGVLPR